MRLEEEDRLCGDGGNLFDGVVEGEGGSLYEVGGNCEVGGNNSGNDIVGGNTNGNDIVGGNNSGNDIVGGNTNGNDIVGGNTNGNDIVGGNTNKGGKDTINGNNDKDTTKLPDFLTSEEMLSFFARGYEDADLLIELQKLDRFPPSADDAADCRCTSISLLAMQEYYSDCTVFLLLVGSPQ